MTESKRERLKMAGKLMLGEGLSLKRALIRVGYSEETARCPGANGLSAKRCYELAMEDEDGSIPAAIRTKARKLLLDAIEQADPKRVSLSAAARTAEVAEKVYGHRPKEMAPRDFAERLEWMQAVMAEIQRRKQGGQAAGQLLEGDFTCDE